MSIGLLHVRDEAVKVQDFTNNNKQNHVIMGVIIKVKHVVFSVTLQKFLQVRLLSARVFEEILERFNS